MLYYCSSCTRVFNKGKDCPYCNNGCAIELKKNAPVNIIGTKVKGKVFKKSDEKVLIVVRAGDNSKVIKEYPVENLRKII